MNITVVCDVLGDETNGTTIAAMNLIRFLQSQNHNVKILCADQEKKGLPNFFVVPNLSIGFIGDYIVKKNNVTLAKPKNDIVKSALDGAEHVHIMLPFALGRRALKFAREMNISTTAGFHAQAENFTSHFRLQDFEPFNRAVYKNFYKGFYRYVDAIHYPTQFIKDDFETRVHVKTNGYIISNGVNDSIKKSDAPKPDNLKDKIVILSTGRYSIEKSQETLIKAIKYSKYADSIQLILAGQGPLEKKFKRLSKKLKNPPIFKIYNRDEIPSILNMCDLYVHPATIELEGISCLEAICAGKLVIVSDSKKSATKGFAVDDRCIFKSKKPKELAKCIDFWIDNPAEKKICEEKYLAIADGFNQTQCMKKMEQMIFEVHNKKLQNN